MKTETIKRAKQRARGAGVVELKTAEMLERFTTPMVHGRGCAAHTTVERVLLPVWEAVCRRVDWVVFVRLSNSINGQNLPQLTDRSLIFPRP